MRFPGMFCFRSIDFNPYAHRIKCRYGWSRNEIAHGECTRAASISFHASMTQTTPSEENFLSNRSQTVSLNMLRIKSSVLFPANNALCGVCERMLLLSLHALLDDAAWIQIHENSSSARFRSLVALSLCLCLVAFISFISTNRKMMR